MNRQLGKELANILTVQKAIIEQINGIQPKLNQLNHHFNWLVDKDYKQKDELKSYDIGFKNCNKYKNEPSLFKKQDENELLNGTRGKEDEELLNGSKGRDDEELLTGSKGKGDEDEVLSRSNDNEDEVLSRSNDNEDEALNLFNYSEDESAD